MRCILVSLCVVVLSIAPAAARMYQWRDATTGTPQLSGSPPAWYRGNERGPRVYVFDNNQLIDDTGIAVSAAHSEALRARAFGQRAPASVIPPAPAQQLAPAADQATPPTPSAAAERVIAPAAPAVARATADQAAALKNLIDAWDQHQLDQARSLLDMVPAAQTPAPAPP